MGVLVALLLLTVVWIVGLVDAGRKPPWAFRQAGRSKDLTVILMFITGVFGTAYWYVAVRGSVLTEVGAGPDRPLTSDDDSFGRTF